MAKINQKSDPRSHLSDAAQVKPSEVIQLVDGSGAP